MKINSDDPRLTAYALGELDPSEIDAFEELLEECPEAKTESDSIREAAMLLKRDFEESPRMVLSEKQKSELVSNRVDKIVDPGPSAFSGMSKWLGMTAAAACFLGMSVIGVRQMLFNEPTNEKLAHSFKKVPKDAPQELVYDAEVSNEVKRLGKRDYRVVAPSSILRASKAKEGFLSARTAEIADSASLVADEAGEREELAAGLKEQNDAFANIAAAETRFAAPGPHPFAENGKANRRLLRENQRGRALDKDKIFELEERENKTPLDLGGEEYGIFYDTPFFPVLERPLSTFAVDVDTASYANVRRFIGRRGQLPPADAVRVEELINYFDYDYPQSDNERPFSVHLESASCPWQPGHRLVKIALKAKELHSGQRPSSNLVFLVDCSGSMESGDKLPLLKRSLVSLVKNLTEDDRIGIVTYAGGAGVALDSTHGDQKEKIIEVIDGLQSGGGTNGEGGIRIAYDLAAKNYVKGGTNRVILATDGDFNVGISDKSQLVDLVKGRAEKEKVFLTALGFGEGNIKDARLEQIANNGNGEYYYIDSVKEGQRVLVDKMSSTLVTVAKDVKVQVDFNPGKVKKYRLIGYANRRMSAREFRDDKKDAGEIGAGHSVTALYQIVPTDSADADDSVGLESKYRRPVAAGAKRSDIIESDELLTVALRYKGPEAGTEDKATEFSVPLTDAGNGWDESSEDFRFAASVAGFGMLLRRSEFRGDANYELLLELAEEGIGKDENGLRREFVELVRKAKGIKND